MTPSAGTVPVPTTAAAPEPATVGAQPAPTPTATAASGGAPTPAHKEIEEPQNALTKKFTDAEWKALKEFRVRNPFKCIFMSFN